MVPEMGAGLRSSEATVTVPQVPPDPQEILGSTVIGPAMPEVAKGGAPPPQGDASASSAVPRPQSSAENSGQPAEATAGSAGGEERVGISETEVPSADVEASFGYFTPRSLNSQFASAQAGRAAGGGSWHGWVSRLGELFTQPAIPNWLPSPIPSPPRPPSLLQRRSPWEPRPSTAQTPSSSSVPAEAIQAEVQRQLGTLLDRLAQSEAENHRLQEMLTREQRRDPPLLPVQASEPRSDPGGISGSAQVPVVPKAVVREQEPVREAVRLREGDRRSWNVMQQSSGDPWASIWEGLSGLRGGQRRAGAARDPTPPRRPDEQTEAAVFASDRQQRNEPTARGSETQDVIEALAQSMKQLQEIQMSNLKKHEESDKSPEVVKTATVALPLLAAPEGELSGLLLQDWLVQVTTAMQDLSAGSGEWWEEIRELVARAYSTWLTSTPLERLQVVPEQHVQLMSGRWTRVNARACSLMIQSFTEPVRLDLIARRSTQSAALILFRLFTAYQPGGAAERSVVLRHLQGAEVPDLAGCLSSLRSWPRWLQRCKDLNMVVPDGSILAKGLTVVASKHLTESPDAVFRTQLVRSTYRVDGQPSLEDVVKYQQHLQAEIESIAAAKTTSGTSVPTLRAVSTGGSTSPVSAKDEKICKYFMKASGCRRGPRCPFKHSMESLPRVERSRKCLACGSEEHRQKDCPVKSGKSSTFPTTSAARTTERTPTSPTSQASAAVSKLQTEPEGETSPAKTGEPEVTAGQPVLSWEALLQAAAKVAGAVPSEPKAPSMKVVSISTTTLGSESHAQALVDSGATHPLRRARDHEEWRSASPVVVHLAGGEVVELKMNKAGTLLVPITDGPRDSSASPIVPLGALVGMLGYSMEWSGANCRLVSREGEVIKLKVRDGCPEVTEAQALSLIAKIEDQKLEMLRQSVDVTKTRIRESVIALNKTWFDHLLTYCDSETGADALQAIQGAPFFQEVPQESLAGLAEAIPITNGWDAMRGLRHLNRRTRRRFWLSRQWVVHLYAGKKPNEEINFLDRQGFDVLELDVERGKSQDVCDPLVWRALEWAARTGRIAAVIGGPPQNTFMLRRSMSPGPEPLRSNTHPYGGWPGQSEGDLNKVNRHTGLFVKMIYLHALATAGRCKRPADSSDIKEVGFLLEQPRDPRGYLLFSDPLTQDSVSFWRTSLWEGYEAEAGLTTYTFDMSSLGKALKRHTTVGTNLPLRHLDGLRGRIQRDPHPPLPSPPSVWTREFSENVAIAVRAQRLAPMMLRMSAEQWRDHVRRGHLPYRSDCMTCVTAGATGRRHSRIEHPSAFVMSADVSGPLKVPGVDADGRGAFPKPHKYAFVAKVKVPKTFLDDGRGVGVASDPGELDAAVPPGPEDFDFEVPGGEPEVSVPVEGDDPGEDVSDDHEERASAERRKNYDEDIDVTGPDLVNLIFSSGLPDNKGSTVLEAIQDVVLYCSSLNIPIIRFHCDRGMEFYARSTRQWIKNQGIRFTTSEGGLHQQNGMVENAVKYVKQRARTLLHGAKLPQKLWPQALAAATAAQRATAMGFETKLAAPFGSRVLVRRREYGGSGEPGKPDDLAPRWVEGWYLGLSETLRRGHLVYVSNEDGEKFVHTVHVRAGLVDPGEADGHTEADLPEPPPRRVREKARGGGDVVAVSKVCPVTSDVEFKTKAKELLDTWCEEEANELMVKVALSLGPNDQKFGVFRHGGSVGLTRVTYDKPWMAELMVRAIREKAPEAEFTAVYVSVNSSRDVHVDSNNLMGTFNYVLPVILPRRGGDLWVELADGDIVKGKVTERVDGKGEPRYGCVASLREGHVTTLDPRRRHAVTPWKGLRVVLVGYTPGVPQNISMELSAKSLHN